MVWTVNDPLQMMEAVRWNVAVILTDKPKVWLDLRKQLSGVLFKTPLAFLSILLIQLSESENSSTSLQYGRTFLWTSPFYYRPAHLLFGYLYRKQLEKVAGPFVKVTVPQKEEKVPQTDVPPAVVVAVAA